MRGNYNRLREDKAVNVVYLGGHMNALVTTDSD